MSRVDYYDNAGGVSNMSFSAALRARSKLSKPRGKMLLVMVGMPARGKSFLSYKLDSFLSWSGHATQVFNVGQHRRGTSSDSGSAKFFDSSNAEAKASRERMAFEVLRTAIDWLLSEKEGAVAIFDATNSTRARREKITATVPPDIAIIFVESICNDPLVVEANMRTKIASSPDFKDADPDAAFEDLKQRIKNYERVYESVGDDEGSYIKAYDFSSKVAANMCFGKLSKTIVPYLMAVHTDDRPVYICALPDDVAQEDMGKKLKDWWWGTPRSSCSLSSSMHGASIDSGRSSLFVLASTLAVDATKLIKNNSDLVTVSHTSALNPLLSVEESDDEAGRMSFNDRSRGGESYADLVKRLESCVLDFEAAVDPVLIVTHRAPARALRAYFLGTRVKAENERRREEEEEELRLKGEMPRSILEIRGKVGGGWEEKIHRL